MNKLHKHKVSRKFKFDAGHRVHGHEGKCANVHGHEYRLEVYAESEDLDNLGRVIDFSVLKKIGEWLDTHWDHGMLLYKYDPIAVHWAPGGVLEGHKYYLMGVNPTAENISSFVLEMANEILFYDEVKVTKVVCWETINCCAEASL